MLPKWFDKWNADNPKDVFGPAILVGTVGGRSSSRRCWWPGGNP
jgi:hypothetical protein